MADRIGSARPAQAVSPSPFVGLVEACPDAVVISELGTERVVAANAAACSLFGLPQERLVGADRATLVDPSDPRLVEATISREQTGRYRGSFRIIRGDGRAVEAIVTTVAFVGPTGTPLVGSIIREADAPESTSDTTGDVFISAVDMIVEIGEGSVITEVNEATTQRLGYSRDELVGRPVTDFIAPESHELVVGRLGRRLVGNEPTRRTIQFDAIAKSGERLPVSSTAVTLFDGDVPTGVRVVLRDLTERRRAEDVERSYRQLFASAFEILVSIAPDGTIEDINEAGARLAEFSRAELVGRKLAEFFARDEVANLRAQVERRMQGLTTDDPELQMTLVSRSGVRIPLDVTATAVYDGARLVRFVAVAHDLRPARAADEARKRLEAEVNHAEKLRSLGVLAGGIAHDFNNILMAILGSVSLARRDGAAESEITESLDAIEEGARRAAELANQMLAYAGQGRYVTESVDAAELVASGAERVRDASPENIQIHVSVPPEPVFVSGDPSQLRQLVFALISNAAEAIDGSTGRVAIEIGVMVVDGASPSLADGRRLTPGRYVTIAVSDTGPGIDAEAAARIFEPFFTTKTAGRGLGLAAVLGIARGHGGGLTVDSTPGVGSTFRALLPAGAPVEPPAGVTVPTGAPGRRVLVIDDENAVRSVVSRMLGRSGYDVIQAVDGRSGLDALAASPDAIDLVLLDLNMPGLSPEDNLRGIHELRPTLPVLLMSGFSEHAAESLGAIHPIEFIQKPFSIDELLGRVATMI
ncbi:MAG: PAS domain S-box protein [Gaiellales bacterium]